MFGYVKIYKPELRIKEYEMYKAVYCTLCKKLGREYGPLIRFTLSYDFTFLALLKLSLKDEECGILRSRCTLNPIKKCNYCTAGEDDFEFSSAVAMIMLYFKLLDNISDEKGFNKLKYSFAKQLFSSAYKKAANKHPEINELFGEYFAAQQRVEEKTAVSIDEAAEPTATMLSRVFMLCASSAEDIAGLSRLGYCIGRYIYITDAAADLEKDIKKKRFNPFIGNEAAKKDALHQIELCVNEAANSFEELNICKYKNILGNIIYLGLEKTAQKELKNE